MKFKFDPRTGRMVGNRTQILQRHEIERLGGIVPDNRHINPGTAYIPEKDAARVKSAARRVGVDITRLNGWDKDIGGALYRFERTITDNFLEGNMKMNENSKITLTMGQLKRLVEASTQKFTIIGITEWYEDDRLIDGDCSHEDPDDVRDMVNMEHERKECGDWIEGLPFTCMAENLDDALDQYNQKFCEYDYLKACDADYETA